MSKTAVSAVASTIRTQGHITIHGPSELARAAAHNVSAAERGIVSSLRADVASGLVLNDPNAGTAAHILDELALLAARPSQRLHDFAQTVAHAVTAPYWWFRMRYLFRHDHLSPPLSAAVIGATVALVPITLPLGALAGAYLAAKD